MGEEPLTQSLVVKALRWACWSWGNPHSPEPPCPTDDEFDTIAAYFGYPVDRGESADG
jgi:hypothetical protein